jgi:hypothetical protein
MNDNVQTKASRTHVVVGCKYPNGLILELGNPHDEGYQKVVLNGANHPKAHCGTGITENVPANFMEAWLKRHKNMKRVFDEGVMFVVDDVETAIAKASDRAKVDTGFNPIDPTKDVLGADGKPVVSTDTDNYNLKKLQAEAARNGERPPAIQAP